tara:strand:+ start:1677 stop:2501 length:825 start_codon:yes stop_codon:yes gene_type:complete
MNSRILAFAGSKQAGKSTCCNFLHGYQLRAQEVVQDFFIDNQGKLAVKTEILLADGKKEVGDTYIDLNRKDTEFIEWAIYHMWPFVKKYSFADSLKDLSVALFGLTNEQVYGNEAYKSQQVPHLRWENMPGRTKKNRKKSGPMTVREFLQYFGTNICRKMYEPVWVKRCIKDIQEEQPLLGVIDDCRFGNEIEAVQNAGGKVIALTRRPFEDDHVSERIIKDNPDAFDAIIDNKDMDVKELCIAVMKQINEWGWLGEPTVTNHKTGLHTIKAKE